MMKLTKLYSVPAVFDPIEFQDGVNIILGEKVASEDGKVSGRQNSKTNGVGKSLCIEFINFCLLKSAVDSRVMLVPVELLPRNTRICLDLVINGKALTIVRTTENPESPVVIVASKELKFNALKEASMYLSRILFPEKELLDGTTPSFRELLSPLMRDERSEFKELLQCHEIKRKIADRTLAKPHLYFFHIDFGLVDDIEAKFEACSKISSHIKIIQKDFVKKYGVSFAEAKTQVNSLRADLEKIKTAIESYELAPAHEGVQDDLSKLNLRIDALLVEITACRHEIRKIESLVPSEDINVKEIGKMFNQFREGLGEKIVKNLAETIEFKNRIEEFQKYVINERLSALREEKRHSETNLRSLDGERARKLKILGLLRFEWVFSA